MYEVLRSTDTWNPDSDVYYRAFLVQRDGKNIYQPVCMQWFDEYDYYHSNFLNNIRYELEADCRAICNQENEKNNKVSNIRDAALQAYFISNIKSEYSKLLENTLMAKKRSYEIRDLTKELFGEYADQISIINKGDQVRFKIPTAEVDFLVSIGINPTTRKNHLVIHLAGSYENTTNSFILRSMRDLGELLTKHAR